MLVRHSLIYALARGVPGIVNFLAITVYTRMLSPDQYGQYALVIAAVGLIDSVLFQWLRLGLLRFLPRYTDHPQVLLATLVTAFMVVVAFTASLGAGVYLLWPGLVEHKLLATGMLLLWIQAWFELNLELARSQLAPSRYGLMSIFKSLLALTVGILMVLQGAGALGPLFGLIGGMAIAIVLVARREWRTDDTGLFDRQLAGRLVRYGLPMTATYSLAFLVGSSDRFMLAWFLGANAPGLYAPGYDLTQFSLMMLMMVVNLAAYPMVVRALEQKGVAEARKQLENVLVLTVAVALPFATGLAICSENISGVLLGETYRETATTLIPMIAISSFLFGIKVFYLDLGFQLSNKTYLEPWVMVGAALVNIVLNFWWIPTMGLTGAAAATLVSYTVGAYLSWKLGRGAFPLPSPPPDILKIAMVTGVMALSLWFTRGSHGSAALLGQITLGAVVYTAGLILLNVAEMRKIVLSRLPVQRLL